MEVSREKERKGQLLQTVPVLPDETAAEKFFAERRWGKDSEDRLRGMVEETVKEGATVYTDQNPGYKALAKKNHRHESVNHGTGEYIKGKCTQMAWSPSGPCSSADTWAFITE